MKSMFLKMVFKKFSVMGCMEYRFYWISKDANTLTIPLRLAFQTDLKDFR